MENHPIENLMKSTMESIRDMIDVNTIVGEPVETKEGSIIIPISRVSFGFASGGSEFSSEFDRETHGKYPFGGGSGAGVTIKPVAFLVLKENSIRLLQVEHSNTYDKIIDSIPQVLDSIKNMFDNDDCSKEEKYND